MTKDTVDNGIGDKSYDSCGHIKIIHIVDYCKYKSFFPMQNCVRLEQNVFGLINWSLIKREKFRRVTLNKKISTKASGKNNDLDKFCQTFKIILLNLKLSEMLS